MNEKQYNQKPFKASEVESNGTGWIVDLSSGNTVNPDCYWHFGTRKQANQFLDLLNSGKSADEARYIVKSN
jgi:hypothetical protein